MNMLQSHSHCDCGVLFNSSSPLVLKLLEGRRKWYQWLSMKLESQVLHSIVELKVLFLAEENRELWSVYFRKLYHFGAGGK